MLSDIRGKLSTVPRGYKLFEVFLSLAHQTNVVLPRCTGWVLSMIYIYSWSKMRWPITYGSRIIFDDSIEMSTQQLKIWLHIYVLFSSDTKDLEQQLKIWLHINWFQAPYRTFGLVIDLQYICRQQLQHKNFSSLPPLEQKAAGVNSLPRSIEIP